jgi:protease II
MIGNSYFVTIIRMVRRYVNDVDGVFYWEDDNNYRMKHYLFLRLETSTVQEVVYAPSKNLSTVNCFREKECPA